MAIEQLLFYQHNVQAFMLGHVEKYEGVIIPLSVATAFKDGTDGFIRALCKKSPSKAYMIDPRSALFQDAWDRKHKRGAHERMAAQLGDIAVVALDQNRPLTLGDMNVQGIKGMIKTSLNFQLEFGQRENAKLKKYAKLAGVASLGKLTSPRRLIPPYFQFVDAQDQWFSINLALLDESRSYLHQLGGNLESEVCPILHFRSYAAAVDWSKIAKELLARQIKMCFLYPNNFKETDARVDDLSQYRVAVETLSKSVRCYSLHGGYLSAVMSKFGLTGFGNGIGYGEWRDSGYHKGGMASVRIYIPKLHRYVPANETQALLVDFGEYFAEDSDLLSELLRTGTSALAVSSEQANEHFLACRAAEGEFVNTESIATIKSELQETFATLEKSSAGTAAYAQKWRESLAGWMKVI